MPKAKRPDRFVVGYMGKNDCVYGVKPESYYGMWTDPMTLSAAEERLKWLPESPVAIYELVPVKIRKTQKAPR